MSVYFSGLPLMPPQDSSSRTDNPTGIFLEIDILEVMLSRCGVAIPRVTTVYCMED